MPRLFALPFLLFFVGAPSMAQDVDPSRLEDLKDKAAAEKSLEADIKVKKDKVKNEISVLSRDVRNMSSKLSNLETQQDKILSELEGLNQQRGIIADNIGERKKSVTQLLSALQRIESNPPPALAVSPNDAANASRAGILMAGLTDQLSGKVKTLQRQLEDLNTVEAEIETQQSKLAENKKSVSARKNQIESKVKEKNALERSLSADYAAAQSRRKALAAEAESLQDLIDQLERKSRDVVPRIKPDPNAPDPQPEDSRENESSNPVTFAAGDLRFSASKGRLHTPVSGKLRKRYASSHPGITIDTKQGTQVWAPAAGRVEFAGAFKNYGQVAILNVGDGYYVLLTGLGRVLVQSDSDVSAGDPVGLMPVNSSSNEKLYIEVRKNGSTIDPVPWFGTTFAPAKG